MTRKLAAGGCKKNEVKSLKEKKLSLVFVGRVRKLPSGSCNAITPRKVHPHLLIDGVTLAGMCQNGPKVGILTVKTPAKLGLFPWGGVGQSFDHYISQF